MTDRAVRSGVWAVMQASSTTIATAVFLPGVLVRVAFQTIAASTAGMSIAHRGMVTNLGGEVEHVSGPTAWTRVFAATVLGPVLLGTLLLAPTIVRSALLDVRPFASISADPAIVVGQGTSWMPFLEASARLGPVGLLRVWFGFACFYCCVPSVGVLAGAAAELSRRRPWSPLRRAGEAAVHTFRALRAADSVLVLGFAGTYLASGLIVLLTCWGLLSAAARAWLT